MMPHVDDCPYRAELVGDWCRGQDGAGVCRGGGRRRSDEPGVKHILVYAPDTHSFCQLLLLFEGVPGCSFPDHDGNTLLTHRNIRLEFVLEREATGVLERLHRDYFNLLLIDIRSEAGTRDRTGEFLGRAIRLLEAIEDQQDSEIRYGLHRVVAMVSSDDDRADLAIAALGGKGVGRIIRDRSARTDQPIDGTSFARSLLDEMLRIMLERRPGKRVLCASGGGITGIYFEMGVIKCLDDCIGPVGVRAFDLYYGISAGAIVTGLLANGYSNDEMMAAIAGHAAGRVPPLSFNLVRPVHIDFGDLTSRLGRALRDALIRVWRSIRRADSRRSAESPFLPYKDLLGAPLHGNEFERILRALFTVSGATNDFRKLARPLFIGATDQDLRTHVIFGDKGFEDVPISKAIQASFAVNPAFNSTQIGQRYYEDGAVTRTSNFEDAIRRGADLIFVIDPFVPYVSKTAGYARKRGLLYNIDQDIRTISYTRFEARRADALRYNPHVSSYTFLPANSLRQLMSINPMDHRPYLEIWRGAYLCTLQRINLLRYRLRGDIASHGMTLDTSRAEVVADRLRRVEVPEFADFFPDRRIELRLMPLGFSERPPSPLPQVQALPMVEPPAAVRTSRTGERQPRDDDPPSFSEPKVRPPLTIDEGALPDGCGALRP